MAIDEQELRPDVVVHAAEATPHKHEEQSDLERLCINTIRTLAMDAVQKANSGHPGTPMGLAPVGYTLFTKFLKHDPGDPSWPDRDRFVLSAGHACLLQYALLHLTGYDLSLDDITSFRQWGSRCAGHPERGLCPGVEVSTGPLGQGIANGIGLAIAERMMAARFNRPGHEVVNHHTYVICGDGDLMEGVSAEAASCSTTTTTSRSRAPRSWPSASRSGSDSRPTDGTCCGCRTPTTSTSWRRPSRRRGPSATTRR
jgi:transketolase